MLRHVSLVPKFGPPHIPKFGPPHIPKIGVEKHTNPRNYRPTRASRRNRFHHHRFYLYGMTWKPLLFIASPRSKWIPSTKKKIKKIIVDNSLKDILIYVRVETELLWCNSFLLVRTIGARNPPPTYKFP